MCAFFSFVQTWTSRGFCWQAAAWVSIVACPRVGWSGLWHFCSSSYESESSCILYYSTILSRSSYDSLCLFLFFCTGCLTHQQNLAPSFPTSASSFRIVSFSFRRFLRKAELKSGSFSSETTSGTFVHQDKTTSLQQGIYCRTATCMYIPHRYDRKNHSEARREISTHAKLPKTIQAGSTWFASHKLLQPFSFVAQANSRRLASFGPACNWLEFARQKPSNSTSGKAWIWRQGCKSEP